MYGFNGKILYVNLSKKEISVRNSSEKYYKRYLGGRGIIIHKLLTEVEKGIDPLGPKNNLIFAPGLLTGHPLPGSGRNSAGAISPLTGAFGEAEGGGYWGAEVKRAGYDAIVVEGASSHPVYIWIQNDKVELRDAGKLWGLEIADTDEALKIELDNQRIRTAIIGPSGEKLVRFACIANDIRHTLGRTGLGAVMGSKKLKAIAVKGSKAPKIADKKKLIELSRWMGQNYAEKAAGSHRVGTGILMPEYELTGSLPIRNFQGGRFPGIEKISPQHMFKKGYVIERDTCFTCPIQCKRVVSLKDLSRVDSRYCGPEFETLAAFGSNCGVDNVEALIIANEICERNGIDTISAGAAIAFAMECYEQNLLTKEDTNGLALNFGNADAVIELVERISHRKGLGDLLAEGTKRASQRIGKGSSEFAMHVKGLELPMHDPRYKQGLGLHYSVHSAGADHCTGIQDDLVVKNLSKWESINLAEDIPPQELSPRKVRMLYEVGLWRHMTNYLGMCLFLPWSHQQLRDAVEAVTGWPVSYWKLMKAVERGITLSRIMNLREGFTRKDDILPKRFYSPPKEGPLKNTSVDPEELERAQRIYYQMLGWNENGVPTYGRMVELDIEWASEFLEK